jgi:hypothetical protein
MIEQYFRPGVRFLWNKQNDAYGPTNGAIVNSIGAATNLTYDGLDGHQAVVDPQFLIQNASQVLGIVKGANIPYTWLDYAPGRTSRVIMAGADILSGYMSGCLIVRGTYQGTPSAFHVGTIVNNSLVNKTVKQGFAQEIPANATGFNPAGAWAPNAVTVIQNQLGGGVVATPQIFALVTGGGAFYSILMFNVSESGQWTNPHGRRYWCVGGIQHVPPMNRIKLMASLMV